MNLLPLQLAIVLAAPSPDMALPPSPSTGAAMLLAEGDANSAAGIFEDLWTQHHDPVALAWAGLSRARAGEAAHAVAYLELALTFKLPRRLADAALATLREARRTTTLLAVELDLHASGAVWLDLVRNKSSAPAISIPLSSQPGEQLVLIALDPGSWTLELRRGAQAVTLTLDIKNPDGKPQTVTLREPTPPTPPAPRVRPLRVAGLIAGGNLALLGASIVGFSEYQLDRIFPRPQICGPFCARNLSTTLEWRAAGAGLLGAGLGLAAGALGTYASRPRTRRSVWVTELAVGGALIGSSFIGGLGGATFNRAIRDPSYQGPLAQSANLHSAGAAMLGLGIGLATSATLGLLLDRADTRGRANLRAHVSPHGVMVIGRF